MHVKLISKDITIVVLHTKHNVWIVKQIYQIRHVCGTVRLATDLEQIIFHHSD